LNHSVAQSCHLGSLDHLQRLLQRQLHLQNEERNLTVAAPVVGATASAKCRRQPSQPHSRGNFVLTASASTSPMSPPSTPRPLSLCPTPPWRCSPQIPRPRLELPIATHLHPLGRPHLHPSGFVGAQPRGGARGRGGGGARRKRRRCSRARAPTRRSPEHQPPAEAERGEARSGLARARRRPQDLPLHVVLRRGLGLEAASSFARRAGWRSTRKPSAAVAPWRRGGPRAVALLLPGARGGAADLLPAGCLLHPLQARSSPSPRGKQLPPGWAQGLQGLLETPSFYSTCSFSFISSYEMQMQNSAGDGLRCKPAYDIYVRLIYFCSFLIFF
jgi:hypothetical protein